MPQVLVVDPLLVTLPYDVAFCRALAAEAGVTLVGRPLRAYERLGLEPFGFRPLFYRRAEPSDGTWRTPLSRRLLKGLEHGLGLSALRDLVARDRPDIVHLQWFGLPFLDRHLLGRLARDTALVMTVHDSQTFHGARHASWLQTAGERMARRHLDHLIVHTERTRTSLLGEGIPDARITVLPHPPLPLVAAPPAPRADARIRILFFGSIKAYKGVDVLVEAGVALARRRSDFVIQIAGRPYEMTDGIRRRVQACAAARHFELDLRYVPDEVLAGYVRAADIVVLPYRRIDASGAVAVAIEAEKPIVASAVGVFAEAPMSRHLRLVEPGDAAALAGALDGLIASADARTAAGDATRRLKAALPSWCHFAAGCMEIYAGVTHRGRR